VYQVWKVVINYVRSLHTEEVILALRTHTANLVLTTGSLVAELKGVLGTLAERAGVGTQSVTTYAGQVVYWAEVNVHCVSFACTAIVQQWAREVNTLGRVCAQSAHPMHRALCARGLDFSQDN
jgi:hypothetical protein